MVSTDPSYDNRTIAITLKMQIRTDQRLRVSGYGYGLWCGFKWGPHHTTTHLRSRLESQQQRVHGCAEECGDPLVQSGDRWQTLCVAAGVGAGPQVQRDSGWASVGVLQPEAARLFRLVIVENIANMTSHNTKASLISAIHRVFAELPTALVEKACSQFQIRIEAPI